MFCMHVRRFFLAFSFTLLGFCLNAAVLVVEGKYQNKNVYIQNGFYGSGVGFCAYEVKVNGQRTTDEVNSSAFEVDLSVFNLKMGESVTIEIVHKDGCSPKVLNPEALKPKPSFDIVRMNVDNDGMLTWTAKNEIGSLPYKIEQFKWNKWVVVGEVNGDGTPSQHDYKFRVPIHSGENRYRVKQVGFGALPRISAPVSFNSLMDKPTWSFSADNKSILFSSETSYEVYDYFGNVVKKGHSDKVEISNLDKGKYFLCYDNVVTEIQKK